MSKRKPYVREITSTWWLANKFHKFYMLREATAVFMLLFSFIILKGVVALKTGPEEFSLFIEFLKSPLIILLNIITLIALMIHAVTFFNMSPKTVRLEIAKKKVEDSLLVKIEWVGFVVVTFIIIKFLIG